MPRPLRVGVHMPEAEHTPRWTDLRTMARLPEDVALASIGVGESVALAGQPKRSRSLGSTRSA